LARMRKPSPLSPPTQTVPQGQLRHSTIRGAASLGRPQAPAGGLGPSGCAWEQE
jgi:hypothetical protein